MENTQPLTKEEKAIAKREKAIAEAEKSILYSLYIGISLGFIGLIGYPLTISGVGATLLFIGILIACASLISGFFVGTLFGIPKRNNDVNGDYTLNNSLVEIAEWLTKIIVGLGLVNLKQVPTYLLSMGTYVNEAANVVGKSASVFTMCVVIYFSILGLYIGYNYMRLVLSGKYKISDDGLLEKLDKANQAVAQKTQEVVQKTLELEEQKDKVNTFKQTSDELANIISPPPKSIEEIMKIAVKTISPEEVNNISDNTKDYVNEMEFKARKKLTIGLVKNKMINDPQKNMWGGKSEINGRKLSAIVKLKSTGLYQITLKLESTDEVNNPLEDSDIALFALHNTWKPPYRLVNVENGIAELELYSYGSFTVGAFIDKGKTELELDLAEISGVTQEFIEN